MSHNKSGSGQTFDRDFLDTDVDMQIAHPSPGAEIYTRASAFNLPSLPQMFFGLLAIGTVLSGVYYLAYQHGLEEGQRNLPPIVLAENAPIKIPADRLPDAANEKEPDRNIYGVMHGEVGRGDKDVSVSQEGPADSASGTIESLIADTNLFSGKGKTDTVGALPEGNSITVLPRDGAVLVSPPRPELNRAPQARIARVESGAIKKAKAEKKSEKMAVKAKSPVKVAPATKPVAASERQDFMVQLAASRSRALARGIYTRLQSNYNDLLGRRIPLILRIDLGEKGIYYRVNVPGFARRSAASAFCTNLKKRGQDCLIRKQP